MIVTGLAFLLTGALTVGFTILWTYLRGPVPYGTTTYEGSLSAAPTVGTFLLVALVVPIVGEAIRQIGPLLASRPEFDDLMDGLTLAISGLFVLLLRHLGSPLGSADRRAASQRSWPLGVVDLPQASQADDHRHRQWHRGSRVLWSGPRLRRIHAALLPRRRGHPGQRRLPGRHLPVLLRRRRDARRGLEHLWGLIILAILILRVRNVLHVGLMEAAWSGPSGTAVPCGEVQYCAQCEMPLLEHAAFCNACGTAVRVRQGVEAQGGRGVDHGRPGGIDCSRV